MVGSGRYPTPRSLQGGGKPGQASVRLPGCRVEIPAGVQEVHWERRATFVRPAGQRPRGGGRSRCSVGGRNVPLFLPARGGGKKAWGADSMNRQGNAFCLLGQRMPHSLWAVKRLKGKLDRRISSEQQRRIYPS